MTRLIVRSSCGLVLVKTADNSIYRQFATSGGVSVDADKFLESIGAKWSEKGQVWYIES